MWSDIWFYIAAAGFSGTAALFIFFVKKYNSALPEAVEETAGTDIMAGSADKTLSGLKPEMSKAAIFLKNVHDDILIFNDRLQHLEQVIDEKNAVQEKHIDEVVANLGTIIGKIENLEPQIQRDLKPQLDSLASAVELLKNSASINPAAPEKEVRSHAGESQSEIKPEDPLEGDSKSVYPV